MAAPLSICATLVPSFAARVSFGWDLQILDEHAVVKAYWEDDQTSGQRKREFLVQPELLRLLAEPVNGFVVPDDDGTINDGDTRRVKVVCGDMAFSCEVPDYPRERFQEFQHFDRFWAVLSAAVVRELEYDVPPHFLNG